jgi:signal transduction histidine kinase
VEEEGFCITNHAGEKKMFSLKGVPLLNEHHFIQGSLFIFVDISQRTELESRLKETNVILEKTVQERTQEILETNEKLTQTINDLYLTNQELVQTSEALKESNQQIAEANQMKTSFLASMSHELRTPLNAIIGFSDLILSGIDGPINEKQQEDLQSISRSGRNLLHLINDILDLSKIEAGKMQFKRKVIDINSLLTDIKPIVNNLIGEKQIEFHALLGEEIRFFYADKNKIHQILLNLISNAVKFTEKGAITLSVERQAPVHEDAEEYLRFTVTDTGIGVRDQDIQTIFDEFKQINQSSRNEDGSGLGLSITKKLVELSGGEIWVDQYYRDGSRFHFTVPTTSQNVPTVGSI